MTVKQLSHTIGIGGNSISATNIEVNAGYGQPCSRFIVETNNLNNADLGDVANITLGYVGDTAQVFSGYVDKISSVSESGIYTLEGRDKLRRAVDFLIATDSPDTPWLRENISAEALVGDLLNEAGITDYSGDTSNFTFYYAPFQLVTSWNAINQICSIIAWHCWAKVDGQIRFASILPEPSGAPSASISSGAGGELVILSYHKSTDNLRNKVIIFGKGGITATASASSPYLPSGFYQTAVISSELIDTQDMAQSSANYNLNKWNRLTESINCQALGDPSIKCRDTIEVTETWAGISGNWFVYSITHRMSESQYLIDLTLTK